VSGTYIDGDQTAWVPGTFPFRGAIAGKGSFECACMKDCTCVGTKCFCVNAEQKPVGPGSYAPELIIKSSSKGGSCACRCDEGARRRRRLLSHIEHSVVNTWAGLTLDHVSGTSATATSVHVIYPYSPGKNPQKLARC